MLVHYAGWYADGRPLDSSAERGPASFQLRQVIAGWTEGLQLMVEGEVRRFWIPDSLAYQGRRGMPDGLLVFDIELIEIQRPAAAPREFATQRPGPPGPQATRHPSGLISQVLRRGRGRSTPTDEHEITVQYIGWGEDGAVLPGPTPDQPFTFRLRQVIPGWSEGIGLMRKGEVRRLWVPPELGYGQRVGRPQGILVFDIKLVDFG